MQNIKKIAFLSFAAFLAWQSFGLLRALPGLEKTGAGSLLLVAWLLNLFITGVFAFPSFAFPEFFRLLPQFYYRIHSQKTLYKIYRLLGVSIFRKLLLFFFWGKKRQRKQFFDGTKSGLQKMAIQSKNAECGHFWPFVFIFLAAGYMVISGHFTLALFTAVINIIGNGYPVLLQRFHRVRLGKISGQFQTARNKRGGLKAAAHQTHQS